MSRLMASDFPSQMSPLGDPASVSVGSMVVPSPLYSPEERQRRDATVWTLVQGILAPFQFLVLLVSLALIGYAWSNNSHWEWALWSVVVKTFVLYLIMVTGAIWEKVVFGQYLFAPSFFWEDVVSMGVIALHTAYLVAWLMGDAWLSLQAQVTLALVAYGAYLINAGQFVWKLRMARSQRL